MQGLRFHTPRHPPPQHDAHGIVAGVMRDSELCTKLTHYLNSVHIYVQILIYIYIYIYIHTHTHIYTHSNIHTFCARARPCNSGQTRHCNGWLQKLTNIEGTWLGSIVSARSRSSAIKNTTQTSIKTEKTPAQTQRAHSPCPKTCRHLICMFLYSSVLYLAKCRYMSHFHLDRRSQKTWSRFAWQCGNYRMLRRCCPTFRIGSWQLYNGKKRISKPGMAWSAHSGGGARA
jgi:hypothetical protein